MKKKRKQLPVAVFLIVYIAVIAAAVALDQLTKYLLEGVLSGGNEIKILGDFLTLTWTLNTGASFGGFKGQSVLFFICTVIGLPLFAMLLWRSRSRSAWGQVGFAFILGGTIGNALDRLIFADGFFNGAVRDFISVKYFAVFNVADSFLVVGVIIACIALLFLDYDAVFKKPVSIKDIAEQINEEDRQEAAEQNKAEQPTDGGDSDK